MLRSTTTLTEHHKGVDNEATTKNYLKQNVGDNTTTNNKFCATIRLTIKLKM